MSEYAYSALLLHAAGREINEENIKRVLEAAGVEVDETRIKALVASLQNVNIDEILEKAALMPTQPTEVKEEEKEEEVEEEGLEKAAAGLEALFG
jgi:large subunit ribosomal protein L12